MRAGTTYLYQVLRSHPEIFMSPIKEPLYFTSPQNEGGREVDIRAIKNEAASSSRGYVHQQRICRESNYLQLFSNARNRYRGEASPTYLTTSSVLPSIYEAFPDSKIIMSLRNPAKRAFSHCAMDKTKGRLKGTVNEVLSRHLKKVKREGVSASKYFRHSSYLGGVRSAIDNYGRGNVKALVFEEWIGDKRFLVDELAAFLDVDVTGFELEVSNKNQGRDPRFEKFNQLLHEVGVKNLIRLYLPQKVKDMAKPLYYSERKTTLDTVLHRAIIQHFNSETNELEQILEINLDVWRTSLSDNSTTK